MATITTSDTQQRNIQVYFLAAPEDQSVCEDIIKHLKPITRSSPIPIEVESDFNIPSGADREQYKQRLLEADIVLALISVDFIDNDDIYNRNQKVIERYNKHQTVMIPILVRNFMWKATPFVSLPVVPKNLQPLNNKQFWNSPDDAVMAVVNDIYLSIDELARTQREAAVRSVISAAPVESVAVPKPRSEPARMQAEPPAPMAERHPSEALTPIPVTAPANFPVVESPSSISMGPVDEVQNEPAQVEPEAVQPAPIPKVDRTPAKYPIIESIVQSEPSSPINEMARSEIAQPIPALNVESTSAPKMDSGSSSRNATSQARASSSIASDWRAKYYRTVMLKRAGAILLDHVILYVAVVIMLLPIAFITSSDAVLTSAANWIFLILYFIVMPLMESSKWRSTIGKRILKLQITDREGDRITFLRAVWRNVMRTVVLYSYIISFGLVLVVQYFRFTKSRKLFHDELSGTVIGERLTNVATVQVAMHAA